MLYDQHVYEDFLVISKLANAREKKCSKKRKKRTFRKGFADARTKNCTQDILKVYSWFINSNTVIARPENENFYT